MRIASYNIRYDCKPDNISIQQSIDNLKDSLQEPKYLSSADEAPWSLRRLRVAEILLSKGPSIACFQEALHRQVEDLAELLGKDWSWVGVGRDDGAQAGEYCAIFYKNDLKLLSSDHFWLSETPSKPSKYRDADCKRVCTAARFSRTLPNGTSKSFTLFNTHLDHNSDAQRKFGASMLLARAKYEAMSTDGPVFITGDFNRQGEPLRLTSTGRDSSAYKILTGKLYPVPVGSDFGSKYAVPSGTLRNFKMLDMRGETPRQHVSSNFATFTGFTGPNNTSNWSRIDFVFGGSNGGWTSKRYSVVTSLQDDGVLASDHRPIFVDIEL